MHGGELSRRLALQHGYEEYGVDILRRVHEITKQHPRLFWPGILRGKEPERPPTSLFRSI